MKGAGIPFYSTKGHSWVKHVTTNLSLFSEREKGNQCVYQVQRCTGI